MNKIFNFQSELKSKIQLSEGIFELKYTVPEGFIFTPGQFISIRVMPTHTRAYSIVDLKDGLITLLVDIMPIKFGGLASKYLKEIKVGEKSHLLGPYGIYGLKNTTLSKVFISTSTGIAPFIPMIKAQIEMDKNVKIYNFFGVRYIKDDIAYQYLKENTEDFEYIRCVSRDDEALIGGSEHQKNENNVYNKSGRVTAIVPGMDTDWKNTEFYICGSSEMILDMENKLRDLGADKIYYEKYG